MKFILISLMLLSLTPTLPEENRDWHPKERAYYVHAVAWYYIEIFIRIKLFNHAPAAPLLSFYF